MQARFTLANELTEEGVSGEWQVTPLETAAQPQLSIKGKRRLTADAAATGAWVVILACAVLWALVGMFPRDDVGAPNAVTPIEQMPASPVVPATPRSAAPKPEPITVEIGANGIVVKSHTPTATSKPHSKAEMGKPSQPADPTADSDTGASESRQQTDR